MEDISTLYKFDLCIYSEDSITGILHSIQCNNNDSNNNYDNNKNHDNKNNSFDLFFFSCLTLHFLVYLFILRKNANQCMCNLLK